MQARATRAPQSIATLAAALSLGACHSGVSKMEARPSDETTYDGQTDTAVDDVTGEAPNADRLFRKDAVIEVEIEIDPNDWDTLRNQTRSMFDILGNDCMEGPAESPYTWFAADVYIDGTELNDVGIRKKGFIGSLSTTKPGLKLDFDHWTEGGRLEGLEHLLLNNTPQDATMLRTCLAYTYFSAAGVPSPRCGFAHVTVNGVDMGIYATVEQADPLFYEDRTGHDDVAIFEGTLSDLRDGWTNTYDLDSDTADLALLAPIVDAIADNDIAALETLVDLPAFARFWVGESLLGHWDGYGWNTNNYYIAIDPTDGKARFTPWGTDAVFSTPNPGGGLDWIAANSALTRALAETPEGQALFLDEVERQLAEVWNEEEFAADVEAWADLISPWNRNTRERNTLLALVGDTTRRMSAARTDPWPFWTTPLREALCLQQAGTIDLTFSTEWGTINGRGRAGQCEGTITTPDLVLPVAAIGYAGASDGTAVLACIQPYEAGQVMPYFAMPEEDAVEASIYTDMTVHYAILYHEAEAGSGMWKDIAWMEGNIIFDELQKTNGGNVSGSYSGILWTPAW